LPGGPAPKIDYPFNGTAAEQATWIKREFPPLPPPPPPPRTVLGPAGRPVTLSELQALAAGNHPSIKSAVAAVRAAEGAVKQAGAFPNPFLSWEADTVGTGGAGYQGMYIDQPIITGNKLRLLTAMAQMDLHNAQIALRRAQIDVATQVRSTYFAVLVARENMKVSRALVLFSDSVLRDQVEFLRRGFSPPYEVLQLRPLAYGARFNLLQATNQYRASWKQLASALGDVDYPLAELAGRVDLPVPVFAFDEALAKVLSRHTDVLTAEVNVRRARYALELARVTPFSDYDVKVLVQKDYTTPPHYMVYSANFTLPVPLWNRNTGGIVQAQGLLIQALEGPHLARVQLNATFADAYNRYVTAHEQVRVAQMQIRDQVRAYPLVWLRRMNQPDKVAFADQINAQQNLANFVMSYVTALGAQWTAVVDVANLLQTEDLFQVGQTEKVEPVPDLEHLTPLPCDHPCGAPTKGK
jgi:cobalt-zinc-cadmium efflux system outer membrane protein